MSEVIKPVHVVLCHKCGGNLSGDYHPPLYGCQCMSGYVRDWQTAIPLEQAKQEQVVAVQRWIAHYEQQHREEEYYLKPLREKLERLRS